jgi:type IV secretion system protein VirB10
MAADDEGEHRGAPPSAEFPPAEPAARMATGQGMTPPLAMASAASSGDSLGALLRPTATPATAARVLPTQRLLLPKGSFLDCTLETAIDSTLPGMVTCVMPADVFGADGTTVLLERGSRLTGETRGDVRQGSARVWVLWTEARTPTGVVAALDSPGTDELGRSGLPGEVNRRFFERFGAAILISVIESGLQRAAQPSGNGAIVISPTGSGSIATETLKSTINLPPRIVKRNGDRIQVLVARDIDFRSVYELRPASP